MMIELVTMPAFGTPTKEILSPRQQQMSPFDDWKDRNTEEGEESPEKRHNDPSSEEFLREHVCRAVQAIYSVSGNSDLDIPGNS